MQLLSTVNSQACDLASVDYRYELSPPIMIYSIIQNLIHNVSLLSKWGYKLAYYKNALVLSVTTLKNVYLESRHFQIEFHIAVSKSEYLVW